MTLKTSHLSFFTTIILGSVCLVGLYLAKLYSYILFHTLVEMFSVVIACGIFVIAWNSRRIMDNNYFLFLGIASLFVGTVDLIHTLSYKGMGVLPGYGPNLPTQLWVVARYLQSLSLLAAPFFLGRRLRAGVTAAAYMAVTALLLAAVFGGYFPDCFIEGEGLTPFKKVSEYLICLMLAGSLVYIRRKAESFDQGVLRLIFFGIATFIASELAFTIYTDVYGFSNMVGHFLKFIGFYFVYKALIEIGLSRPYDLLFRELKSSEESYRDLYDELSETNVELETALQDLATSNAKLEVANRDLEAFNSMVSHDLRTPLTNIHGCSKVLLEMGADLPDAQRIEFTRHIQAEAERMDEMITALLNLSRLSHGELSLNPVDLSGMAHDIAARLKRGQPDRRVEIAIAGGLTADGDERLLRLAMDNLFGNAWKYTSRKDQASIEFARTDYEGKQVYSIRDNGAGFDMAKINKLFTPFQRLHSKDEFAGFGIGLASVERIIQRHGGRVWAEGEVGKGATFYFTL